MIKNKKRWFMILVPLFMLVCSETTDDLNLTPPTLLSPQQGETLTENPPTFVWNAVEGDSCDLVYRIEIATEESFSVTSLVISTLVLLPDTTYIPAEAFAPDTYYWHMSVRQNA